jgi:SAM-dependent methyltransferase
LDNEALGDIDVSGVEGCPRMSNIDPKTVSSFGDEWARFDQEALGGAEHAFLFETYFHIFPWETLPEDAQGFDMGCGSGRWAMMVAPVVGKLTCIDPSPEALAVAQKKLAQSTNAVFVNAGVSDQPLPPDSQDFGSSLGVLHHTPDTAAAPRDSVPMINPVHRLSSISITVSITALSGTARFGGLQTSCGVGYAVCPLG